jgi:hypothetical protein
MYLKFHSTKVPAKFGDKMVRKTTANLFMVDVSEEKPWAVGTAYQNPKDSDCKVLGQKHAIENMVKELPKDFHIEVWETFFNYSKATRKLKK